MTAVNYLHACLPLCLSVSLNLSLSLSVSVCLSLSASVCHSLCLLQLLKRQTYLPHRDPHGSFLMAVDHCFSIRGQGTVMTGTVLQGALAINDTVEIPTLKVGVGLTRAAPNVYSVSLPDRLS